MVSWFSSIRFEIWSSITTSSSFSINLMKAVIFIPSGPGSIVALSSSRMKLPASFRSPSCRVILSSVPNPYERQYPIRISIIPKCAVYGPQALNMGSSFLVRYLHMYLKIEYPQMNAQGIIAPTIQPLPSDIIA